MDKAEGPTAEAASAAGGPSADGSTPRYIQLANNLRALIRGGKWRPGEALPAERTIVAASGLSRVTVRRALELLVRDGILEQRHGSGTYVSGEPRRIEQSLGALTGFSEDMLSLGHAPAVRWIDRSVALPRAEEAMMLGLSPGEKVLRLHRVLLADRQPVAVELAVVPAQLVPDAGRLGSSLYEALAEGGHRPEKALQRMRACRLPAEEAGLLECEAGGPAVFIERLARLASGRAVEFTRSYFHGERYDFIVEMTLPSPKDQRQEDFPWQR